MTQRMRGAKASPRHRLASAMPHVAKGTTLTQFIVIPPQLSMWGNGPDPLWPIPPSGDCVSAEEAFAKAAASVMAGKSETFITDKTLYAFAAKNNLLNGAELSQVLDIMQHSGFQQDGVTYNDGPPSSVDWTNTGTLFNAISQGPVKLGVAADQLQNAVGNSSGWFLTGAAKDTNLDHCISACGFGEVGYLADQLKVTVPSGINSSQQGVALATWNTIGIADFQSMVNITGEAWLRNPTTVISGTPPPPNPGPGPQPKPVPTVNSFDQVMLMLEQKYGGNRAFLAMLKEVQYLGDRLLGKGQYGFAWTTVWSVLKMVQAMPAVQALEQSSLQLLLTRVLTALPSWQGEPTEAEIQIFVLAVLNNL